MNQLIEAGNNPITKDRQILVIDDDAIIRNAIVRIISRTYGQIRQAADFSSAQKAIAELPRHGLIISDLNLTRAEEGLELARISRAQREQLEQIFILQSATISEQALERIFSAQRNGLIDGFISKPFTSSQLLTYIQQVLAQSRQIQD
jgi:DNA-binding NtrC family response regulator